MENKQEKVTTIKDIADELGVSMTTVHKAIYNKAGISEETRQRILEYIESHNFHVNRAASALKRKVIRLAYVGAEPNEASSFFFRRLHQGMMNAYQTYRPFNVEMSFYTTPEDPEQQIGLLEKLYDEQLDNLDGLIITTVHDTLVSPIIRKFVDAGKKVVTVNSDAQNSGRHAYITADSIMTGHVAADLLVNLGISENGQVLLVCGLRDFSNHRLSSSSFVEWLHRERPDVDVIDMYQQANIKATEDKIAKYLTAFPDIGGVCCANARTTYAACRAVERLGLSKSIKLVGADIFDELEPFFENGTINASIFQDPNRQSALALEAIYNLISQEKTVDSHNYVGIGIILKSNLQAFL